MKSGRHSAEELSAAFLHVLDLEEFGVEDVMTGAGVAQATASRYARAWCRAGLATVVGKKAGFQRYAITRFARGLVRAQKARSQMVGREGAEAEDQLWRGMRMMREFSPIDLAACCDRVSEDDARGYCLTLLEAGYLRISRKEEPGLRSGYYRLIRDTGPKPPRECLVRTVYDENIGEFGKIMGAAA
jgi:hypothetical protein